VERDLRGPADADLGRERAELRGELLEVALGIPHPGDEQASLGHRHPAEERAARAGLARLEAELGQQHVVALDRAAVEGENRGDRHMNTNAHGRVNGSNVASIAHAPYGAM